MNAAIRMLFGGEDPLAVHLVVAAAFRILHDLAEQPGAAPFHPCVKRFLLPEGEPMLDRALDEAVRFMSRLEPSAHAAFEEFTDQRNDFEIMISCIYLECLGTRPSPEAQAFLWWFATVYPHVIAPERLFKAGLAKEDFDWIRGAARDKQLQLGQTILNLVRRNVFTSEP